MSFEIVDPAGGIDPGVIGFICLLETLQHGLVGHVGQDVRKIAGGHGAAEKLIGAQVAGGIAQDFAGDLAESKTTVTVSFCVLQANAGAQALCYLSIAIHNK